MKIGRSGELINMDLEAAKRLLYYLDIAYNELDNDEEETENVLLGRLLEEAIGYLRTDPIKIHKIPRDTLCISDHYAGCRTCTDPMKGMYPHCPLNPPEVLPDGT
jgi:hypothetical protein